MNYVKDIGKDLKKRYLNAYLYHILAVKQETVEKVRAYLRRILIFLMRYWKPGWRCCIKSLRGSVR